MRRINSTDCRALLAATGLLALGTVVRVTLAPDSAEVSWHPAAVDRTAESLGQAREEVDQAIQREAEAARPLGPRERIDINLADESSLRRLPGVGPSRAAAILRDRKSRGRYASPRDLARVQGIGEGLVARLGPHLDYGLYAETSPRRPNSQGVDINRAQIKELEQITGIGPALAARIVAFRARNGRFKTLDDVLDVPGIGPSTLQNLSVVAYVR